MQAEKGERVKHSLPGEEQKRLNEQVKKKQEEPAEESKPPEDKKAPEKELSSEEADIALEKLFEMPEGGVYDPENMEEVIMKADELLGGVSDEELESWLKEFGPAYGGYDEGEVWEVPEEFVGIPTIESADDLRTYVSNVGPAQGDPEDSALVVVRILHDLGKLDEFMKKPEKEEVPLSEADLQEQKEINESFIEGIKDTLPHALETDKEQLNIMLKRLEAGENLSPVVTHELHLLLMNYRS